MRRPSASLALALLASLPAAASELSPEVQLCLQHLRQGERERLHRAQGPLEELPLYRLQLEVDPGARTVTGRAQVLYTARARTLQTLHLRVTPNAQGRRVKVSHASVNGQPALLEQPEPTLYRVRLDPPVPPGASALVEVRLAAEVPVLPQAAQGLAGGLSQRSGPRDYGAFAASPSAMLLSGILPMVPPVDADGEPWPGPSGLGDLAVFAPSLVLASITVPAGYQALATGAALGEVPERDGRVRFSWAAAGVRDFPVVITRGFEKHTATVNGLDVESWHQPAHAPAATKALEHAAAAVGEFEKRLGPLPHRVLRLVEAPLSGGAGGMEFSGLIVVSSGLYGGAQNPGQALGLPPGFDQLFGAAGAPGMQGGLGRMLQETLELTVAHEVAHQYFPGLVGSDPVTDPVVDEALAQYLALLYFEWKHGAQVMKRIRQEQLVGPYHLYRMGGGADGAAARSTAGFEGSADYAALVYGKAPLLLEAQRRQVGDVAFFKALRGYVDGYRWGWACLDCFTRVLAKGRPDRAQAVEALRVRWWEEARGDEDLGTPDLSGLLQGMTGQKLDPETEALLRQLLPQLVGP
jgi:hypothetical protein